MVGDLLTRSHYYPLFYNALHISAILIESPWHTNGLIHRYNPTFRHALDELKIHVGRNGYLYQVRSLVGSIKGF